MNYIAVYTHERWDPRALSVFKMALFADEREAIEKAESWVLDLGFSPLPEPKKDLWEAGRVILLQGRDISIEVWKLGLGQELEVRK